MQLHLLSYLAVPGVNILNNLLKVKHSNIPDETHDTLLYTARTLYCLVFHPT